jgi:hypothetical protein
MIDILLYWIWFGLLFWMYKVIFIDVRDFKGKDFIIFTVKCGPLAILLCMWLIFLKLIFLKLKWIKERE